MLMLFLLVKKVYPRAYGETLANPELSVAKRVYPRAYGETEATRNLLSGHPGLSPRIRGNLGAVSAPDITSRSIPAHTGKPTGTLRKLT